MRVANYIRRYADSKGWISPSESTPSFGWQVPLVDDRTEQLTAYMCESLYVALTHDESLIALRALLQATENLGTLRGMGAYVGILGDWQIEARNRVEDILRGVSV